MEVDVGVGGGGIGGVRRRRLRRDRRPRPRLTFSCFLAAMGAAYRENTMWEPVWTSEVLRLWNNVVVVGSERKWRKPRSGRALIGCEILALDMGPPGFSGGAFAAGNFNTTTPQVDPNRHHED
jgi:hypothetical protein